MPRRGENIYFRKDGRWEGRYIKGRRPDGRVKYGYIYGRQYDIVKKKLIIQKAKTYQSGAKYRCIVERTMYDWAEHWLEHIIRPHIRQGTYAGYRRNIENHIYPYLRTTCIQNITREQVQYMMNDLQEQLAPSTLHGIHRLLKSILRSAVDHEMISFNPCVGIRLPKNQNRTPRVLTKPEQKKIEQYVQKSGDLEYIICLYTGLRVGEVCALKWKNIDLENGLIHIRHSVQRISFLPNRKTCLVMGTPKSDYSIRDIPLPSFLSQLFQKRKNQKKPLADEFIFAAKDNTCQDPRSMQLRLSEICRKLGLKGVHMHTLRHTFATRCLECNVSYEVLGELLGHSSPQITLKYYAHCTQDRKLECMKQLRRII